jgi:hypothetical protein
VHERTNTEFSSGSSQRQPALEVVAGSLNPGTLPDSNPCPAPQGRGPRGLIKNSGQCFQFPSHRISAQMARNGMACKWPTHGPNDPQLVPASTTHHLHPSHIPPSMTGATHRAWSLTCGHPPTTDLAACRFLHNSPDGDRSTMAAPRGLPFPCSRNKQKRTGGEPSPRSPEACKLPPTPTKVQSNPNRSPRFV